MRRQNIIGVAMLGMLLTLPRSPAWADVITTTSGTKIECIVLQESKDSVVIRRGYGTMTYPRSLVASITKAPVVTEASIIAPTTRPVPGQRVPSWNAALAVLVKQPWATNVQQIPATVVDVGVMKNVPYQSYKCGIDYEVNIYGDPDQPAAIEIGVYRTLLNNADAKRNCVEFIASILPDRTDAAIVRALDRTKDLVTRNDVTSEITPPTSPDAYGGWWVSVYNEKQLDLARASETEMKDITVARDIRNVPPPPRRAGPSPPVAVLPTPRVSDDSLNDPFGFWSATDMASARPSRGAGGGSVYVRGYHRKDGTYVRGYTRSR